MANPDQEMDDKKRKDLEHLKSLEDGIITYITNTDQADCKSIFLSMLIKYVMCYNDYPPSITALQTNNGVGFENYIKNYVSLLLAYYQKPKSSLNNSDVSFSNIKLMLLAFFHKKISIIIPVVNEKQHIKRGQKRTKTLSILSVEEKVRDVRIKSEEQSKNEREREGSGEAGSDSVLGDKAGETLADSVTGEEKPGETVEGSVPGEAKPGEAKPEEPVAGLVPIANAAKTGETKEDSTTGTPITADEKIEKERIIAESKQEIDEQKLNHFEDLSKITKQLEDLLNMFAIR
jgi:hypothetical protein